MTRRRTIVIVAAYVAIGLGLNLAVAWVCALYSPMTTSNNPLALTRQELGRWIDRSPWPFKLRPGETVSSTSFGLQYDRLQSGEPEPWFWHVARAVRAGYPLPAFYGERWTNHSAESQPEFRDVFVHALRPGLLGFNGDAYETRLLPWRPMLPGFLTNTILYAGLAWLVVGFAGALQGRTRRRAGICPRCAAALPETGAGTCAACGWISGVTNAQRL